RHHQRRRARARRRHRRRRRDHRRRRRGGRRRAGRRHGRRRAGAHRPRGRLGRRTIMKHRGSQPPHARAARYVQITVGVALASAVAGFGAVTAPAEPPTTPAAATRAICDSTTALTVIGMDTEAGRVLIAVAAPGGGTGSWIVALDSAGAAGATAGGTEGA